MKSDYFEIIKLFQNVKDNADKLVNLFKKLQEEEKEAKDEGLIRWKKYPDEKPKERRIYLCVMKNPDNNYKWMEQFSYDTESDIWSLVGSFSSPVDKVYGYAPCMWAEIDFPDLEEEND